MSGVQIDDRKAAKAQAYRAGDVITVIVRTSMRNRVGHRLYERRRDTRLKVKLEFAADTTHTISAHLYRNNTVGRLTSNKKSYELQSASPLGKSKPRFPNIYYEGVSIAAGVC